MKLRAILLSVLTLSAGAVAFGADLKIGVIGCDTSHATAFTKLFNDPTDKNHIEGGKVVVFYKGGSPDIKESADRVENIAKDLREKYGVKEVSSVEDLCKEVDVVLLESLDGRPKLQQVGPIFKAHKPVFIDKPIAGSLKDALAINKLAKETKTPWFSSSAYRFYESMVELKGTNVGTIKGASSFGPCELESHHPDFFWYGIHPTEALFTIMGLECESVTRTATPDMDLATGVWSGGRIGTFRGVRNSSAASVHKVIVFGSKGLAEQAKGHDDYAPLVRQIMKFWQTGIAPVPNEETIAIYAFMEAADESKREGGKPVKIADVISKNGGF